MYTINEVFNEMREIHDRIYKEGILTFNILTDQGDYIASESKFENEDNWRVGPSFCEDDFIIEDNTGRHLPIGWQELPDLLRALESLSERHSTAISRVARLEEKERQKRIQELREQLRELEDNA